MLVFLRHAESEGNVDDRFSGRIDYPLTKLGHEQALATGLELQGQIDIVITSDLQRTIDTAKYLNCAHHVIASELTERSGGEYEGKTFKLLKKELPPKKYKLWLREWFAKPPFGESFQDVHDRVMPFYRERIRPLLQEGNRICIVSHAGVIKVMMGTLQGHPEKEIMKTQVLNATPYVFRGPY